MSLAFVVSPAVLAALAYIVAAVIGWRAVPRSRALRASLWLGCGQMLLVAISAALTYETAISTAACLTAILGYMGLLVLGLLDVGSLLWWTWSNRPAAGGARRIIYVVTRAISHGLFVSAQVWHAQLCTV